MNIRPAGAEYLANGRTDVTKTSVVFLPHAILQGIAFSYWEVRMCETPLLSGGEKAHLTLNDVARHETTFHRDYCSGNVLNSDSR
jgi:hypothetical protein